MLMRVPEPSPKPLRVLILDEDEDRSELLRKALTDAGHHVVARVPFLQRDLPGEVASFAPDLVIVDSASPDRDSLEFLCASTAGSTRPIVVFAEDRSPEKIRAAIRAGVSAYVVDGLAPERVQPVIDAAIARFEQFRDLREEVISTRAQLDERKRIERAKGVLMTRKRITEQDAYALLRRMAMDRNVRLVQVAEEVIRMADLF